MTPQQANLAPCPFCGGPARHLERNPGFYDERAICDPCNYSLSPAAWNRRAPAPTEPAVDRDAPCTHLNKTAGWDHLTCDDCGAFHAAGKEWGIADRKWFPSEAVARFYQKNGRWPDVATPASPEVPEPAPLAPSDASEELGTILWLYRRLPRGYGKPEYIERVIRAMAERAGTDVAEHLAERTADPDAPLVQVSPQVSQPSGNTGELPQVAQASQPTSAEGKDSERLEDVIAKLTDQQRLDLFGAYCASCGRGDPSCKCWNDE